LGNKTIPKDVAYVRHLSWPNNEASRKKIEYHLKHFGHCSYKWDDKLGLQIDSGYYTKLGLPIPNIIADK